MSPLELCAALPILICYGILIALVAVPLGATALFVLSYIVVVTLLFIVPVAMIAGGILLIQGGNFLIGIPLLIFGVIGLLWSIYELIKS